MIENIIEELLTWPWQRMISCEDAAHKILALMAKEEMLERRMHDLGGYVYLVNGKLFGRIDGITLKNFYDLEEFKYG